MCMISFGSVDQTVHLLLKKQKTTYNFSSSKIIQQVHKKKFRLQKAKFFYISISSWISIHPNDFIHSIWHGIDQLLCDICADTVPNPT